MQTSPVLLMLLVLLAGWGLWLAARRARQGDMPLGVSAPGPDARALSPVLHDACVRALRDFAHAYRATFRHGQCSKAAVLKLHDARADALGHLYQLRMRMPNDLHGERDFTKHIEDTDMLLRSYIADAQARCGQHLLHPGPIDDMFYRHHYRAHNDVVA